MSYLSVKHIDKSFGNVAVLRDVSVDIEKGEFVCFLGPSGCGKTTLLRIIAGLEQADGGNVYLDGRDMTGEPPSARQCGIVFQSYALFPNMTAAENIAYGLNNKKLSKQAIAEKVNQALALVDLIAVSRQYPRELSGGQQQRVALARAIALEPKLLLLDEPLSALDAKVRETLRQEIKRLQQQLAITTVMVTHDQAEALTMADKVVVFHQGQVMQTDTPEAVYYEPQNAFVADFVGTSNFFPQRDGSVLMARPETIEYSDYKQDHFLKSEVIDVMFCGSFYRAILKVREEPYVNSKVFMDFLANRINHAGIKKGREVYIRLAETQVVGDMKGA